MCFKNTLPHRSGTFTYVLCYKCDRPGYRLVPIKYILWFETYDFHNFVSALLPNHFCLMIDWSMLLMPVWGLIWLLPDPLHILSQVLELPDQILQVSLKHSTIHSFLACKLPIISLCAFFFKEYSASYIFSEIVKFNKFIRVYCLFFVQMIQFWHTSLKFDKVTPGVILLMVHDKWKQISLPKLLKKLSKEHLACC